VTPSHKRFLFWGTVYMGTLFSVGFYFLLSSLTHGSVPLVLILWTVLVSFFFSLLGVEMFWKVARKLGLL